MPATRVHAVAPRQRRCPAHVRTGVGGKGDLFSRSTPQYPLGAAAAYRTRREDSRANSAKAAAWTSSIAAAPGTEAQPKAKPPCSAPMPLPTAHASGQSASKVAPSARKSAA